ncbi:UDP-N-acetylmuramate dehydrogenase [Sulfuritortus calidifontis]|nr:UDP-N-acetylmuramate dehydrogenase [Sulfuritortus calidifontis]
MAALKRLMHLRGELLEEVSMARHVSWRAGGLVERFYTPVDVDDLSLFLQGLPKDEPLYFIGLGSNLLVRDGGLRGTVVHLHAALKDIHFEACHARNGCSEEDAATHGVVYAQAGVASPKVARFAANHDLVGAEFLAGIPGTLGGALAMNAGCYGHETWQYVSLVQTIDRDGEMHLRAPNEFEVGYRHVEFAPALSPIPTPTLPASGEGAFSSPTSGGGREGERLRRVGFDEWFLAAWLRLPKGDGAASREQIKQLLAKRIASQPLNLPNAGSVFRNPPGDYAARLIESCGLKGRQIGQAQVSEKHANFIVNLGGASASDIEALIELVQQTVETQTGVRLQPEVRIIGDQ